MSEKELDGALRRLNTDEETRSEAGSALARRKHALTSPRTRRRQCAQAAKVYWDRLTPEEKRREMRRRRKLGVIRKKQKALEALGRIPKGFGVKSE